MNSRLALQTFFKTMAILMSGLGSYSSETLVQSALEDQNVHQMDNKFDVADLFKPTVELDIADLFKNMGTASQGVRHNRFNTDIPFLSNETLVDQSLLDQLQNIHTPSTLIKKHRSAENIKKLSQLNIRKSNSGKELKMKVSFDIDVSLMCVINHLQDRKILNRIT
jgi:hypothetical protein